MGSLSSIVTFFFIEVDSYGIKERPWVLCAKTSESRERYLTAAL